METYRTLLTSSRDECERYVMEYNKLYSLSFTTDYKITITGKVWSVRLGKFLKEQTTGRGYVFYILYLHGLKRAFFRHRLLCMCFKPIENSNEYTVDHINGIPGDDRLENLEWVTIKENIRRYWKGSYPSRIEPILRYDLVSNTVTEYSSYLELAKVLNVSRYEILRRLSRRFGFVFKDLSILKYKSDPREFPVITDASMQRLKDKLSKEIVCFNHYTGTKKIFSTMQECANYLNVVPSVITTRLRKNQNFFNDGHEIRFLYENHTFKQLDKISLFKACYSNQNSKPVFLIINKEILFFTDCNKLAKFISMPPSTLNKYLVLIGNGHCLLPKLNAEAYTLEYIPDELLTKYIECNELDEH